VDKRLFHTVFLQPFQARPVPSNQLPAFTLRQKTLQDPGVFSIRHNRRITVHLQPIIYPE
jgi:hypothetical protein